MTGPGRPRTGTPILVRIPAEDLAALDRAAERSGLTRALLIRNILGRYVSETLASERWEARRRRPS